MDIHLIVFEGKEAAVRLINAAGGTMDGIAAIIIRLTSGRVVDVDLEGRQTATVVAPRVTDLVPPSGSAVLVTAGATLERLRPFLSRVTHSVVPVEGEHRP